MIEKIEAVVLNTRKFGDSSKIAHIFSREHGKISILAKGAFKPKSKFAGSLEALNHIELKVYFKQNKELQTVSDVDIIKNRHKISIDSEKLATGLIITEIIYRTQREGEFHPELFEKLIYILNKINDSDNYFSAGIEFILFLISTMGFAIDVNPTDGNYFSTKKGKFYEEGPDSHFLDDLTCNHFKALICKKETKLNNTEFKIILDFLIKYLSYHIERDLKLNCLYLLD